MRNDTVYVYDYRIVEFLGEKEMNVIPCGTWETAQHEAGKIVDAGPFLPDTRFEVEVWRKRQGEDAFTCKKVFGIDEFINMPNPGIITHIPNVNFDVALEDKPESGHVLDKEPFHHLDEAETREVLMYTETGYILGELARRLEEYNVFVKKIEDALSTLDINA